MLRRGVGIGAVRKKQEQTKQFTEVGDQIAELQISHISEQLESFRTKLQEFAIKYKHNIKKDPEFRKTFQIMCAKIGVDPLASKKGFWSELLDVGDFYYELAVQIIEVCIITRPKNGGLIGMSDLLRLLAKKRNPSMQKITDDDVKRAVKKLNVLGEGFQLIEMEERTMIVTVPIVLSPDHSTILALAQTTGGMVNVSILARELHWDKKRSMLALNVLLREGMTWIDEQDARRRHFSGRNHKANVKLWYDSFADQAQRTVEAQTVGLNVPNPWVPVPSTNQKQSTPDSNFASNIEPINLASLPPSMLPAPPEAFLYCRTDWG